MKEIYGVFSGCYSDWDVKCYFESEEEAEQYCYYHNQTGDEWDRHYVMVIPFGNQDFPKTKLYKHYRVFINLNYGNLATKKVYTYDASWYEEIKSKALKYDIWARNKIIKLIVDNVRAQDDEVAKKIAQDIVAEFKSLVLVEGLTLDEAVKCINKG